MKKILAMLLFFSLNSLATTANYYECFGKKMSVVYFRDAQREENSHLIVTMEGQKGIDRQGNALKVSKSPIGSIVTVERTYFPAGESRYYSFIIPEINIVTGKSHIEFITAWFTHSHWSNPKGIEFVDGLVDQVSDFKVLSCQASIR